MRKRPSIISIHFTSRRRKGEANPIGGALHVKEKERRSQSYWRGISRQGEGKAKPILLEEKEINCLFPILTAWFLEISILVHMLSLSINKNWAIVVLLLCGLFMFSPLFEYLVKWDSLDQYLPFRYFLSFASDAQGPALWLPYQSLGYPVYGDMQSGFWYPITWLHILFGPYDFLSFNVEVLLHLLLAGIGMYGLGKRCGMGQIAAFSAGLSYMACGHLVGTCHVYTFVISATWLPFVLFSLIDLRRNVSRANVLKTGLFIHLFVSGGYPAFSMILFYFMIGFFIHWFWQEAEKKKMAGYSIALAALVLLMGLGYLAAQVEVMPYMSRSEALPYNEFFYHNSFSLKHWWSFIFPIMISTDGEYFASDLSMINAYVGVFIFLAATYAMFRSDHKWKWGLFLMVLFALAASAGPETPLRFWLYEYVPGFDLFRHPALFRIYAIIGLILLGGIGLDDFLKNRDKAFVYILLAAAALLTLASLYLNFQSSIAPWSEVFDFFMENGERSTFGRWSHFAFISIPISLLLWGMWYTAKRYCEGTALKVASVLMVGIICIEVILTTAFSVPTTVINNIKLSDEKAAIDALPNSELEQVAETAMASINMNTQGVGIKGVWRNLGIWSRRTAVDGYNPFQLKVYDTLKKDTVLLSHGLIFTENGDVSDLRIAKNEISALVNMVDASAVQLVQSPYPGWHVYVDGKESEQISNVSTPATIMREGNHLVSFRFENSRISLLFWISMSSFLLTVVLSIVLGYRKRSF